MFVIYKTSLSSPVDYAAEELRKYFRMMMPHCGAVEIKYDPEAKDGFRLGLMQDFGLDISDADNIELDDILYIDTNENGGIIAGDNPRSVLLSVYEYLRQNGCRWLFPGVDGEYIPMQAIKPVKYRHKPSCRYRGQCNEGAEFQTDMLEVIEFAPKIGMNVFMMEHFIPSYYRYYYDHKFNEENRPPEPAPEHQILQWKRQCEVELTKRGIQFHDIGHGFTSYPFGLEFRGRGIDYESEVKPETRKHFALIDGKRFVYANNPYCTNFCMSSAESRALVVKFVVDYAKDHPSDYLHVWLADGVNNHCECENCKKKTPSDWYMILMNEIDEGLTAAELSTRIVFIAYVDTIWAPLEETIKNTDRFTLLFAPIHRSYAFSLPEKAEEIKLLPYNRNKNIFPADLAESFAYLAEWRKMWRGSCVTYEYHFWRHQAYDISGLETARRVNDDVKIYKEHGVDGVIEDGSQRSFFPNGFAYYSYARTLFDNSLSYDEILEDYYSHAYGKDWRKFRDYLRSLYEALPFSVFSRDMARARDEVYYNPEASKKIATIRDITKEGRELIKEHYNSDVRIQTASVRLLEHHADFCDLISDWMVAKTNGEDDLATELYNKARIEFGKREYALQTYFDHFTYFGEYSYADLQKSKSKESILTI